jgi:hypothetical protein
MMKRTKGNKEEQAPNLRPPTMMIDLLFGALMLFAFQMGAPTAKTVVPHNVDLPTANDQQNSDPAPLLALKPMKMPDGSWRYNLPDGRTLGPKEIAQHVHKSGKTPVLIVSRGARVQDYVDAEQPLRLAGLKAGLAVELDEGEAK